MGNHFCKNDKSENFQTHPEIINRINTEFDDFIKYGKKINLSKNLLNNWNI